MEVHKGENEETKRLKMEEKEHAERRKRDEEELMEKRRKRDEEELMETRRKRDEEELMEKRALLLKLEKDLEEKTVELSRLGQKVVAAVKADNEKLEEKLNAQQTFAREQQKELKEQAANLRKEVEALQVGQITAKQPAGTPIQKVYTEEKDSSRRAPVSPFAVFLQRQLNKELGTREIENRLKKQRFDPSDRYLELDGNLNGRENGRTSLYFRDSVKIAINGVVEWLLDPSHRSKQLLLGGSRGTGKSIIGALAAIRLAAEGALVLYTCLDISMILFTAKLPTGKRSVLDAAIHLNCIPPLNKDESGVFILRQTTQNADVRGLYKDLFSSSDVVVIEDIGDTTESPVSGSSNATRLIVTSPNATKLAKLVRLPDVWTLIVPTWSQEEIVALGSDTVSQETLLTRFERIGGIPRWVNDTTEGKAEAVQDKQIDNMSLATLKQFATNMAYGSIAAMPDRSDPFKSIDLIVRLGPSDNWPKPTESVSAEVGLCSDYVAQRLAERFVEAEELAVQAWVGAASGLSALTHFRGYALEASVHKAFKTGTVDLTISLLGKSNAKSIRSTPEFKFGKTVVRYADLSSGVEVGVYYQPKRSNEPTIDSFAVMNREFITKWLPDHPALSDKKSIFFLIFFQITVAKEKHVVNGTVLRRFQTLAKDHLKLAELPMALIFVTYADGLSRLQAVTRKDGKGKRKALRNQAEFPQFRAVVENHLKKMFVSCAADKALMESEIIEADEVKDVVEAED